MLAALAHRASRACSAGRDVSRSTEAVSYGPRAAPDFRFYPDLRWPCSARVGVGGLTDNRQPGGC